MGNLLIIFGLLIVITGILLNVLAEFHIPLLPGDIFIQKDNFTLYFPIVSSIIISIILTAIINLFR